MIKVILDPKVNQSLEKTIRSTRNKKIKKYYNINDIHLLCRTRKRLSVYFNTNFGDTLSTGQWNNGRDC